MQKEKTILGKCESRRERVLARGSRAGILAPWHGLMNSKSDDISNIVIFLSWFNCTV